MVKAHNIIPIIKNPMGTTVYLAKTVQTISSIIWAKDNDVNKIQKLLVFKKFNVVIIYIPL